MAKDIMQRVFYPGQDVTKIGAEQFAKDSMGMNLDYQLSTMGITGETARLMKASMGNVAAGKSGELTKFDTSGNPINFDYKIRDSEERLAQKSEKGLLVGANTAADALVKLNAALENTPELILAMKGAMQTFTGTKSGGGLSGGLGSIVAGGATIAQSALTLKALQTLGGKAGPTAGRALSTVAKGGVVGTAAALGGQALKGGAEHGSLRSRAENAMKWGGTAAAGAAMFNAIPIGGQIAFGAATAVGAGLGFLFGGPNDGFSASVGGFSQGAVNPSSMSGASSTPMAMPVPGASMSSTSASVTKGAGFGAKDPSMTTMTGAVNYHTGEDIPMEIGTPVHSRFAGKVISRNASRDLGISVEIDHGDGYSSIYGHLNQKVVQTGQEVQVGTLLGKSGATGRVRGPHLHFELRKGKVPTDPKLYTAGGNGNSTSGSSGGGTGSAGSTGGSKVILGTGSEKEWATGLLKKLGAPVQDSSINALTTWMRHEGGHWKNSANYNPLNTTLDVSNNESMNGVGVKRYKSWEEGYTGTIGTLTGNKAGDRGYTAIVDALKAGAPTNDILAAINNSAWMTGKTGKNPYKFQGGPTDGFNTSVNSATPGTGMSSTSPGVPTSLQGGTNNVYVTLQIQQANQQEAEAFAKTIKKYLEKDNKLHEMGRR
jgi:murein DD-endopeptidase MepM/ murein hydrolase activator NlpD